MKIEIKSWLNGAVLFEGDFSCLADAVSAAVKKLVSLRYANLTRANLTGANLTGADLTRANLTRADLTGADLTGADLTRANLTRANLTGADLTGANLTGANLTGANLTRANLTGADLTGADLTGANLTGADLTGANLTGADLTKIYAALPDIENPDAKILKIIADGEGQLAMDSWHECETTHCRAGWYIRQSGAAGEMLEAIYGSSAAGAIIFSKAYPARRVPNFYASDEEAMEDMRENAAKS